jgi:hypothetical protein
VVAGIAGALVVVVVVDELLPHPLTTATGPNRNRSTILRMAPAYPDGRQGQTSGDGVGRYLLVPLRPLSRSLPAGCVLVMARLGTTSMGYHY